MKHAVELLAPAGSLDALRAAVSAGADAVYAGSALFGARASARFDEDSLRQAVRLAHFFGRRIHVTVNTLCKQEELPALISTLEALQEMRVDAVLVQDLGVLKLCLERFPRLPVHASTQMALHNASGARFLQSLGVQRIVLARECTLPEIRAVAETGIETEVFAHGAMCVGVSGQCLFSSLVGGRSGNRGRCAQPCRMQYAYHGQTAAWLSPADLCMRDAIPALLDAGVASLKIEGRLKRPEYVYIVTNAYRKAIDAALEGRFSPMEQEERDKLTQIFSRGAFTSGYACEKQDAGILYPARVTPIGLNIGCVMRTFRKNGVPLCEVRLTRPLHNGDGLEIAGQSIIYSGPEAEKNAVLRLHEDVHAGDAVRRTEDERQLSAARAAYEGNALFERLSVPFDAALEAQPNHPARLTLSAGGASVCVTGDTVLEALGAPLNEASALRSLEKAGGTPFHLRTLSLKSERAFLPASKLNALRRKGLEALEKQIIALHVAALPVRQPLPPEQIRPCVDSPRLVVRTERFDEIPALQAAGAELVLFSPADFRPNSLRPLLARFPKSCVLCLPPVCEENTLNDLRSLVKAYGIPFSCGSIGQLDGSSAMTDFGVPVCNGEAEALLCALNISAVTLSPELSCKEIKALPAPKAERLLPVYGRMRLMVLTHCPERVFRGLCAGHEHCRLCEAGQGVRGQALTDRRGCVFPLSPFRLPEGCRVQVLHSAPLNLLSQAAVLRALPVSWLLHLTDEAPDIRLSLVHTFKVAMNGEKIEKPPADGTLGRFSDGVL